MNGRPGLLVPEAGEFRGGRQGSRINDRSELPRVPLCNQLVSIEYSTTDPMHDEPYCQSRLEQRVLVRNSKLYTSSPCVVNMSGASSHTVAWRLVIMSCVMR